MPQKEVFYPKELSITHVAQGVRSGDCDFLSVINAILALPDGESYIRNLLIEKDGVVYVHFLKMTSRSGLLLKNHYLHPGGF
ncbi:hypothetical protein [Legionella tunisiensis]|uniref:hypothetical protein n=1 Tax=Legionella tunisiensis TaxID=1034944 RepID=UPI0002F287CB|nr:hypothetical protein [Legionella tunisiensis]